MRWSDARNDLCTLNRGVKSFGFGTRVTQKKVGIVSKLHDEYVELKEIRRLSLYWGLGVAAVQGQVVQLILAMKSWIASLTHDKSLLDVAKN